MISFFFCVRAAVFCFMMWTGVCEWLQVKLDEVLVGSLRNVGDYVPDYCVL